MMSGTKPLSPLDDYDDVVVPAIFGESIMLKLIPPFKEVKPGVLDTIDRSGATFVEVDKLYKLWPHVGTGAIVIAAITTEELATLQRHMGSLLAEMPSVVTGVPGTLASAEWNMLAAHLPSEPFSTLETQLLKSGYLSHTTEQSDKRGAQIMGVSELGQPNSRFVLQRNGAAAGAAPAGRPHQEEPADDDDDLVTV